MKIRSDFVSNSSSSSYIIRKPKDINIKDLCIKICDWSLDKEYKWKNDKIIGIEKTKDYDKNVSYRSIQKDHLIDLLSNYDTINALPIYLKWHGWYKLMNICEYFDYYNYDVEMDLGGKIPKEIWQKYLEEGEKFLENFDEEYCKWVQEYQNTDNWFDIEYCGIKENLKKDIEWIKSIIQEIDNNGTEFYGLRISNGGDCDTSDGIYSFETIGLKDLKIDDCNIYVTSEGW